MNDLKVFSSTEFGELGVMLIDGKEYFPATQCAKILGYADPFKAIKQHCKSDGWVKRPVIDSLGRTQEMKFINEGNLYRLIVSSKLPAAEKFERWVFDEVLPTIRKTGSYGAVDLETIIAKTATAVVSEVMKQLAPLLTCQNTTHSEITIKQEKFKKPRKATSTISRLNPVIKNTVNDMILSDAYTYQDVCNYLKTFNIEISISSVYRYTQKIIGNVR